MSVKSFRALNPKGRNVSINISNEIEKQSFIKKGFQILGEEQPQTEVAMKIREKRGMTVKDKPKEDFKKTKDIEPEELKENEEKSEPLVCGTCGKVCKTIGDLEECRKSHNDVEKPAKKKISKKVIKKAKKVVKKVSKAKKK